MNPTKVMMAVMCMAAITVMAGCTWVKTTEAGSGVTLSVAGEVGQCQRLGKVNVSVKGRIGRINRKMSKVKSELGTLARNEGAVMSGNTVVAESEISDGRQEFGVYDCP